MSVSTHDGGSPGAVTGKVRRLEYDCFGEPEAFVLATCEGEVLLRGTCDRGVERVLLQACRDGLTVTVWLERGQRHGRVRRLEVRCC